MIVDIGAAEGYYAVGLAKVASGPPVTAFEATQRGRLLTFQMAEMNGVADRLKIQGFCDRQSLTNVIEDCRYPLVVCDCEGGEFELIDPVEIPKLKVSDILVEVHGRVEVAPGEHPDHPSAMAEFLSRRFRDTHDVTLIKQTPRLDMDWPTDLDGVSAADQRAAMCENRAVGSCWLWMRARSHMDRADRDRAGVRENLNA
jgi:hypothetical protein